MASPVGAFDVLLVRQSPYRQDSGARTSQYQTRIPYINPQVPQTGWPSRCRCAHDSQFAWGAGEHAEPRIEHRSHLRGGKSTEKWVHRRAGWEAKVNSGVDAGCRPSRHVTPRTNRVLGCETPSRSRCAASTTWLEISWSLVIPSERMLKPRPPPPRVRPATRQSGTGRWGT